jgi:hypothetical protein
MKNDLMNRWIAVAGFAVLAVVLFLEGAALSLTLQDRAHPDSGTEQPQPMMHFLFDRIAAQGIGTIASASVPAHTTI